jgi:hypothetical protein
MEKSARVIRLKPDDAKKFEKYFENAEEYEVTNGVVTKIEKEEKRVIRLKPEDAKKFEKYFENAEEYKVTNGVVTKIEKED